jgi:hypothetical protein
MTYPKFGATFFDLGRQLPRQILTKSKKFQNSKTFLGKFFLNFKLRICKKKFDTAIAGPNQKRLLQISDMSYI